MEAYLVDDDVKNVLTQAGECQFSSHYKGT